MAIGLIGSAILYLWPDKRWPGWATMALGVAILFGAILWEMARHFTLKEFNRQHPALPSALPSQQLTHTANTHNEFKPTNTFQPTVNVSVPVSQTNNQKFSAVTELNTQPVVIECGLAHVEATKIDRETGEVANLYRVRSYDPNNSLVDGEVAFAKFRRDDEAPISWIDAKASIEFLNTQNKLLYRVDKAYWWQTEGHHHDVASFRLGDTQKMIVALIGSDGQVFPYAGHYVAVGSVGHTTFKEFVLETRESPLPHKTFIVHVEIVGIRENQRRVKQSFDYDLTIEPKPEFKPRPKPLSLS